MQASQPAPRAWPHGSIEVAGADGHELPTSTLEDELKRALRACGEPGDAFVFGTCSPAHELALQRALPREARIFGCLDGAARAGRGPRWIDPADFDESTLRALRGRHHVQRVSVVVVADDFTWSLGRALHGLRSWIASDAVLLVAGRQAALLETLWLDELRAGQSVFDVSRMDELASSWARFTLRRRQFV